MELKLQVTPKAKPSFQLPWSQLACGVLEEVNVSQRIPSPPACLAISFPTHLYARGGTTYLRICRLLCWHSTHQSTQIDQLPYTTEMAAMEMMMTKLQNVSWLNLRLNSLTVYITWGISSEDKRVVYWKLLVSEGRAMTFLAHQSANQWANLVLCRSQIPHKISLTLQCSSVFGSSLLFPLSKFGSRVWQSPKPLDYPCCL